MTVQELITELNKIQDKDKEVFSITNDGYRVRMNVYFKEQTITSRDGYLREPVVVMYGEY